LDPGEALLMALAEKWARSHSSAVQRGGDGVPGTLPFPMWPCLRRRVDAFRRGEIREVEMKSYGIAQDWII
jgi:hypothetical protein